MDFTGLPVAAWRDSFTWTATANNAGGLAAVGGPTLGLAFPGIHPGTHFRVKDGREFVWAQAGAANLVTGTLLQSAIANGSQVNLALANNGLANGTVNAAAAVGAQYITVVPGAALTLNQYQGGKISFANGAGSGFSYYVKNHLAGNSTVNVAVYFDSSETLQVTPNTASRVDFVYNEYVGVIINPVVPTGTVVGVAVAPIQATLWGYVQTHGPVPVLCDAGAANIGLPVVSSANTAGAYGTLDTASTVNGTVSLISTPQLGIAMEAGVSAQYKQVFLLLD